MEGRGGIVVLSVSAFQIKLKGIVPGRPNGTIVTQRDGPPAEIQGTEETTRPPKGSTGWAAWASAQTGTAKTATTLKAIAMFESVRTFSLYTGLMSPRSYLPSAQFMVIVASLLIAGGTVAGAQYYISSKNAPAALATATLEANRQAWEDSLAEIQAQSGITLPDTPSGDAVQTLLSQAQSGNLTDSIGRGLLVKLTNAGVQGLGSDIPTQETIIAEAIAQINASQKSPRPVELSLIEASEASLRSYGNAVMAVFAAHPKASFGDTLLAIAKATDAQNKAQLAALEPIGRQYLALAEELSAVPVPQTLSPLHLQAVQNLYLVADTYPGMAQAIEDPLRGLAALQQYQLLMSETGRILTNVAEALRNSGILFTKDEPGSAWEIFLSAS